MFCGGESPNQLPYPAGRNRTAAGDFSTASESAAGKTLAAGDLQHLGSRSVRCGNLPPGVRVAMLRATICSGDVLPWCNMYIIIYIAYIKIIIFCLELQHCHKIPCPCLKIKYYGIGVVRSPEFWCGKYWSGGR